MFSTNGYTEATKGCMHLSTCLELTEGQINNVINNVRTQFSAQCEMPPAKLII